MPSYEFLTTSSGRFTTDMKRSLENRVREAIRNAAENGYDFADMSNLDIAVDMCCYDSSLENEDYIDVAECLVEIRS